MKFERGVAGLNVLLSVVTLVFVIGLVIMIFSLMGGELSQATSTPFSGSVADESVANFTDSGSLLSVGNVGVSNEVVKALIYGETLGTSSGSFPTGFTSATGITTYGNDSYVTGFAQDEIKTFWSNGTLKTTCATTVTAPMGMATDGAYVWVTDYNTLTAYQFTDNLCNGKTSWSLNASMNLPAGMYYENNQIYVVSEGTDEVFVYWAGNKSQVTSWASGVDHPWGIVGDGTYLYIGDRTTKAIFKSYYNGTLIGSYYDVGTGQGEADLLGIALNNTHWLVHSSDDNTVVFFLREGTGLLGIDVLTAGNYSIANGVLTANPSSTYLYSSNIEISYDYVGSQNSVAGNVIQDTTSSIAGTVTWFPIILTITAMVVLILLTVIIITSIRSSGLIPEESA